MPPTVLMPSIVIRMELTIVVQKTGGIWHGRVEGSTQIDERGLTAAIAERKARAVAARVFAHHGRLTFKIRRIDPEMTEACPRR